MTNVKSIVAKILATTFVFGLVPTNVFALEVNNDDNVENLSVERATYIGTTGAESNDDILPPTKIPYEIVNGSIVAYCMEPSKPGPMGDTYRDSGDYYNNSSVQSVAFHGYPHNGSGLQQKYGLDDRQARSMTQYVLWEIMDPTFHRYHSNGYIDELRELHRSGNIPSPNLALSTTNPKVQEWNKLQVSELITTNGNYTGTFTFPSNEDVYSVDANGKWKQTFNIGESFKIVAKPEVKGSVSKNIAVSITTPVFVKLVPDLSNLQILAMDSTKTVNTVATINLNFPGIKTTGDVIVHKVDETGISLPNVEFSLYSDAALTNKLDSKRTDANGKVTFADLDIDSEYFIKETSGLEGYVVDSSTKNITIKEAPQTITVVNDKIYGKVKIIKTDDKDINKKLKGAKFTITDSNGVIVDTIETGEDGVAVSKSLPYGDYKIAEIESPEGYNLSGETVDIKIDAQDKQVEIQYTNRIITGSIKVVKLDSEDKTPIAGVKFDVKNKTDDSLVGVLETDENGEAIIENLPYGEYYVVETEPAEGYVVNETIFDAKITVQSETVDVEVLNDKIKGSLELLKYDAETKEPLANVEFTITCVEGFDKDKEITFVTDEDGLYKTENINYGKYVIVEIKTLEGYVLDSEPIEFTIDENGQHITVEKANRKAIGEIIIHKVDEDTKDSLAGAIFRLYDADMNKIRDVETGEDGLAVFDNLVLGKYYFEEIQAPNGYLVDLDMYEFEIKEDGQVIEFEFDNVKLDSNPDKWDEEEEDVEFIKPLPDTSGFRLVVTILGFVSIIGAVVLLRPKKRRY